MNALTPIHPIEIAFIELLGDNMRLATKLLTFVFLGSTVTFAQAALLGPAADYNVFVFGDYISANSDTEGNLAAGGDVNLANYYVASKIPGSSARLVADGNLTASNGGVGDTNQQGTIYAGSTVLTSFTAGGGIQAQTLVDFTAAESQYKSLSTNWGGLAANGTTSSKYGTLSLTGTDSALSVFSVTASELTNSNSVNIEAPTGSTVLINVSGSGQTFQNGQVFLSGVDETNVLYNFIESTSLSLAGSKNPRGTVFAPFANVTGGYGQLNGQLIAQSFDGNIEMHDYAFSGDLPITTVPVPAAIWLFGSALGLFGAIARKKRSSQPKGCGLAMMSR